MSKGSKVVVAMSGGVDSSATAFLLKEQGYDVIGITMQIWPSDRGAEAAEKFGGCCSLQAVEDARRVAFRLNIPHYVLNFREIFAKRVIADFCKEYVEGRTPNPCIRCNQYIKFDALLKKAKGLDANYIATGHYARIEREKKSGRYLLKKSFDSDKDQSYVLYTMTQDQLAHTLMPLGEYTKEKVREIATRANLPVAQKPESQEICFIPDNDYGEFLRDYLPDEVRPGPILDKDGNILGEHKGVIFYTIGQRKGLGIAHKHPLYVIDIDKAKNAVIVGRKTEAYKKEFVVDQVNYVSVDSFEGSLMADTKIRYQFEPARAEITSLDEKVVRVQFDKPQRAITPGQAAVFYDKDAVIGGGTIKAVKS